LLVKFSAWSSWQPRGADHFHLDDRRELSHMACRIWIYHYKYRTSIIITVIITSEIEQKVSVLLI